LFGRDEVARVLALELPLSRPYDADVAIAALATADGLPFLEVRTSGF